MKRLLFIAPLLAAISAQAHPGHESFSLGLAHFLQSPTHVWPMAALSALLFIAARLFKARAERNLLRATALFLFVAALIS